MKKLKLLIAVVILMFSCSANAQNCDSTCNTVNTKNGEKFNIVKTDGMTYEVHHYISGHSNSKDNQIEVNNMVFQKITEDAISVTNGYVLKEDNTVWKINEDSNEVTPYISDVKEISATGSGEKDTALFVKNDGTLWGVGANSYGQLAQGEMDKSLDDQITENQMYKESELYKHKTKCTPERIDTPVKIMDNVKSAITYQGTSIALKEDGTVWTWGYDSVGELGMGVRHIINNAPTQILANIKQIFASGDARFALDNNNVLWRWGSNYVTYFGVGDKGYCLSPEKYLDDVYCVTNMPGYNLVVKTDRSLWVYGDSESNGGVINKTPLKLADDVITVNGLEDYMGEKDRILVLKQNRDLLMLNIFWEEDNKEILYGFEKITGNVRLPYDNIPKHVEFADISNKSEEMCQSVNLLSKAGIIEGISDNEFSPDRYITRAEIAALLLRIKGLNEENGNGGFIDVTEDKWYYNIAGTSKKYGIVSGFDDNTFCGDEPISKIQMITLTSRSLNNNNIDNKNIISYPNIPDWALKDTFTAKQVGLILDEIESINPNEKMTRGEAAVILYRLYNKI